MIAGVQRRISWDMMRYVMLSTTKLMGMLMWITIAAVFFSKIYVGVGAGAVVGELIEDYELSPNLVIIAMLVAYLVLGMFLDGFAIVFITVPLFVPIVRDLGFDTTWFAVLFILSMQSAYLTPPFGYNNAKTMMRVHLGSVLLPSEPRSRRVSRIVWGTAADIFLRGRFCYVADCRACCP